MTEFCKAELDRLVRYIPEVSPESRDYEQLLRNIESFCAIAPQIEVAYDEFGMHLDHGTIPFRVEPMTPEYAIPDETPEVFLPEESNSTETNIEESTEVTEPEKPVTAEEVKVILRGYRAETGNSIPELLKKNWGVDSFSALPESKYAEVVREVNKLLDGVNG